MTNIRYKRKGVIQLLKLVDHTLINSRDTAEKLGISYDTLRKYNTLFYEEGYAFQKVKNKVMYSQRDIEMLQQFLTLHKEGNYSLRDCASVVVNGKTAQQGAQSVKTLTATIEEMKESQTLFNQGLIEELEEQKQQSQEHNKAIENLSQQQIKNLEEETVIKNLINQVNEQSKQLADLKEYINTNLETRDQQMINTARDIQEIKKTLSKKPWWKFW